MSPAPRAACRRLALLVGAALLVAPRPAGLHQGGTRFCGATWTVAAQEHRVETFEGRETLWLRGGSAVLEGAPLADGVLECELLVTGARGFSGVQFRRAGPGDYEHVYVRPHRSGQADATQYQPVFHGVAGWQIYTGPSYCAPVPVPVDTWTSLRVEFRGDRAQVFLAGERILVVALKRAAAAGGLALASGFAPARFADVRFAPAGEGTIPEAPPEVGALPGPDRVDRWSVSEAFPEAALAGRIELPGRLAERLSWQPLDVETNGIANLTRLQGLQAGDTVLARLVLEAERPTRQRLDLGFSDRLRVFHDGVLAFEADDTYASRDERFLGTVGSYDAVLLPLHAGRNVVDLAVSESFGGWAVAARLAPAAGVRRVEIP